MLKTGREPEKPAKFDSDKFLAALHDLLVAHNVDFAVIWLRKGNDLITQSWINSPEAAAISKVIDRWTARHKDELVADIALWDIPEEPKKDAKDAENTKDTMTEVEKLLGMD